jgi:hypothetical protein
MAKKTEGMTIVCLTSIRIFSQFTARVFVGSVGTVGNSVTEEAAFDTRSVVTGQHAFLAEGLIG